MNGDSTTGTGQKGEDFACRYLEARGCRILDRNWRSTLHGRYEIDIVAEDSGTIVFCEVKTAKTNRFGSPVSWVTKRKMRRIASAALAYISAKNITQKPFRFDVIGLELKNGDWSVVHIPNAFTAPEGI